MTDPLVTIVTPSFNQGRFIGATIESVLAQNYPRIEYIVMDGGSTDETAEVVARYGDRLTWISERDRGQAHAINKGFHLARGEIVAWINSDDVLFPGAVATAVAALRDHPDAGAVYGDGQTMDEEGVMKGRFHATEPFDLWKLIHLWDYVLQQSVYFRKEVLDEVGYLDEDLTWTLDWDLLIRIGRRYGLAFVPDEMGALREYDDAKSFSGGHRRFREIVETARRYGRHRYPPAYKLYGLDTYEGILGRFVDRLLPRRVAGLVRERAHRLVSRSMERVVREAKGTYPGGWVAVRSEWMLPALYRRIRIRGTVHELPGLEGQSLSVRVDGVVIGASDLGFGDFDLQYALPASRPGPHPLIVLEAKRGVPGRAVGLPEVGRPVAFTLGEVSGLK